MTSTVAFDRPSDSVDEINRRFYGALWSHARVQLPDRFNTWPLLSQLSSFARRRLEVGPGMRPRLPIPNTHFLDQSCVAVQQLAAMGGIAIEGEITRLPYRDAQFDLVCAFDVIEHVADEQRVVAELSRVLRDDGTLVLSVPLHAERWSEFDRVVGHYRRYEPPALAALLAERGLCVEKSAGYGMKPRSAWLTRLGVWGLQRHFAEAMRWYNRLLMPAAIAMQKRLEFQPGLRDTDDLDEIVVVCRRIDREAR